MAFKSDKQRKGFFVKQGNPRSSVIPQMVGRKNLNLIKLNKELSKAKVNVCKQNERVRLINLRKKLDPELKKTALGISAKLDKIGAQRNVKNIKSKIRKL